MRSDGEHSDCSNASEEREEYQTESVYNHCGKLPISLSREHLLEQARAMLIAHKLHNIIELRHTTTSTNKRQKLFFCLSTADICIYLDAWRFIIISDFVCYNFDFFKNSTKLSVKTRQLGFWRFLGVDFTVRNVPIRSLIKTKKLLKTICVPEEGNKKVIDIAILSGISEIKSNSLTVASAGSEWKVELTNGRVEMHLQIILFFKTKCLP